jgi:hypothetical protein
MARLWLDWVRAPHVHVLILWRDRPRARCIGRVRLAALALSPGLNFGAGKSSISATMQNLSMQDECFAERRAGKSADIILDPLRSVASVRDSPELFVPIGVFVFETLRLARPTTSCGRNRGERYDAE